MTAQARTGASGDDALSIISRPPDPGIMEGSEWAAWQWKRSEREDGKHKSDKENNCEMAMIANETVLIQRLGQIRILGFDPGKLADKNEEIGLCLALTKVEKK